MAKVTAPRASKDQPLGDWKRAPVDGGLRKNWREWCLLALVTPLAVFLIGIPIGSPFNTQIRYATSAVLMTTLMPLIWLLLRGYPLYLRVENRPLREELCLTPVGAEATILRELARPLILFVCVWVVLQAVAVCWLAANVADSSNFSFNLGNQALVWVVLPILPISAGSMVRQLRRRLYRTDLPEPGLVARLDLFFHSLVYTIVASAVWALVWWFCAAVLPWAGHLSRLWSTPDPEAILWTDELARLGLPVTMLLLVVIATVLAIFWLAAECRHHARVYGDLPD